MLALSMNDSKQILDWDNMVKKRSSKNLGEKKHKPLI